MLKPFISCLREMSLFMGKIFQLTPDVISSFMCIIYMCNRDYKNRKWVVLKRGCLPEQNNLFPIIMPDRFIVLLLSQCLHSSVCIQAYNTNK